MLSATLMRSTAALFAMPSLTKLSAIADLQPFIMKIIVSADARMQLLMPTYLSHP